jgi:PAS domain S-box-containing protein
MSQARVDPSYIVPGGGHHVSGGRNVVGPSRGTEGKDIFFAAVQMSRMPMCLSDPHLEDSPIVFCNQAFEQLTGYAKDEIIGRNCRFLQGEETDPEAVAEIRRTLRQQEDCHLELINYRKDGSSFWNALFISPVVDTEGNLIYHFASQLDVSRRRETEAAMLQTQRMDTLGSMASSLAHEFNNLMTIVLANLERLETEVDTGRRAKQVERATWGARRAARLTDQILSFTRRQFHDNQNVDVNHIISGCDAILDQMAGSGATVLLDFAGGALLTSLDAGQLEMALLNLVRNAADAAPPGSRIVVTTRRRLGLGTGDGATVEIAVADTGAGMTPEIAARAMEPFFTTKAVGKGPGWVCRWSRASSSSRMACWRWRPCKVSARQCGWFFRCWIRKLGKQFCFEAGFNELVHKPAAGILPSVLLILKW